MLYLTITNFFSLVFRYNIPGKRGLNFFKLYFTIVKSLLIVSTRISGDEQSYTCLYYWQIELRRGNFVQKKTLNKIHENVRWQTIIMENVIWIWMKTIHEKLKILVFQNAVIGNVVINIYGDRDALVWQ